MADTETVIKGLHTVWIHIADTLHYYESRELLQTIDDAIAMLKERREIDPCPCFDDTWQCVNCGAEIGYDETQAGGIVGVRHNYCPGCGSKIRWEATDDE